MKKLAICLYSHLRTFELTHKSFLENVVNANKNDGWDIKIFISTWDTLAVNDKRTTHHKLTFNDRILSEADIKRVKEIYKPQDMWIGHLEDGEHGFKRAFENANLMCEKYENRGGGGI